jgi:hypothetical protein
VQRLRRVHLRQLFEKQRAVMSFLRYNTGSFITKAKKDICSVKGVKKGGSLNRPFFYILPLLDIFTSHLSLS